MSNIKYYFPSICTKLNRKYAWLICTTSFYWSQKATWFL